MKMQPLLLIALCVTTSAAFGQAEFKYDPLTGDLFIEANGEGILGFDIETDAANVVSFDTSSLPGAGQCVLGSDCWDLQTFSPGGDPDTIEAFDTTITAPGGPFFTLENETQNVFATLLTGLTLADFGPFSYGTNSSAIIETGSVIFGTAGGLFDPGDFDEDGDVDSADRALWEIGYGTTGAGTTVGNGNADDDNDVDGFDFLIWQQNFTGPAPPLAASSAVPEPTSLALGSLTLFCWSLTMRSRRNRV